jgi:hypothetical protein
LQAKNALEGDIGERSKPIESMRTDIAHVLAICSVSAACREAYLGIRDKLDADPARRRDQWDSITAACFPSENDE